MGHGSSWSCFFTPIASPLCSQEVALALSTNQLPPCVAPAEGYRAAAAAAERVVCVNTSALNDLKFEASAAGSVAERPWAGEDGFSSVGCGSSSRCGACVLHGCDLILGDPEVAGGIQRWQVGSRGGRWDPEVAGGIQRWQVGSRGGRWDPEVAGGIQRWQVGSRGGRWDPEVAGGIQRWQVGSRGGRWDPEVAGGIQRWQVGSRGWQVGSRGGRWDPEVAVGSRGGRWDPEVAGGIQRWQVGSRGGRWDPEVAGGIQRWQVGSRGGRWDPEVACGIQRWQVGSRGGRWDPEVAGGIQRWQVGSRGGRWDPEVAGGIQRWHVGSRGGMWDTQKLWGEVYAKDPDVVELRGEVQLEGTEHKKLHWWRAQAVRFMLRWPSAHLCHVINQQRHTAYGMHTANRIARQAELHSQLQQSLPPLPPPTDSNAPSASAAAEASAIAAAVATAAAARFADGNFSTDSTAAPAAAAACAAAGGGASGASLVCEPYMVRPIVSMHVRQSDKQVEMGVWSFAAHMLFAARLQRTLVDLKHVWLSTEMQASQHDKIKALLPVCSLPFPFSVINEAATPLYAGWTFLYAANGRLPEGALDPHAYDALQSPAASLASLLIAAQCDVFIGSLGSNWSRLINELRATNGRLYNGFVAMNLGEW
ncbi:unnamed protein product [Closterium sp. Naga37s-1]|nr:unnamed protein product [Closterium sp. Naga37s-1]